MTSTDDAPMPTATWCPPICPCCGSQRGKHVRRKTPEAHVRSCRDCGSSYLAVAPIPVWPRERRAVHVAEEARA